MLLILGCASAYDHYRDNGPYHFDVAAIYAVLFFLIGIHWGIPLIFLPVPALAAGWLLRMRTLDIPMETKIAALIGPLVVFSLLTSLLTGGVYTLLYGLGVLLAALGARQWVDHGLWHVLSAIGLALVAHGVLS